MKDLAGSGSGAAAAAPRQLAAAVDKGQDAEEGGVNPAAQQRLGSLADKVSEAGCCRGGTCMCNVCFCCFWADACTHAQSVPSMSPAAVSHVSAFCRTLHPLIRCES